MNTDKAGNVVKSGQFEGMFVAVSFRHFEVESVAFAGAFKDFGQSYTGRCFGGVGLGDKYENTNGVFRGSVLNHDRMSVETMPHTIKPTAKLR
jgi:hypothetical protein